MYLVRLKAYHPAPCRLGKALRAASWSLALLVAIPGLGHAQGRVPPRAAALSGLIYTNSRIAGVPWSIHVVRLERTNAPYEIQTAHAEGKAIGMDTLSGQLATLTGRFSRAVAAINGDFYQRNGVYSGAPRGLQVAGGELLSAPAGGASVWIDAQGQPHLGNIASAFRVTWPDGTSASFGLNSQRHSDQVELYTPAIGPSTRTSGGRELILEGEGNGPWLPLRLGQLYTARVREIRSGNTRVESGTMVLSVGPAAANRLPSVAPGSVLRLSTACSPAVTGVQAAISGGPILVHNGRPLRMPNSTAMSYEFVSMEQRHPRAAVGWNQQYFFLIVVDGRQPWLSAGMTLDELSAYLVKLGCEEALNFDGGGSATLWFDGEVRNSPCDRAERDISNSLIIVTKAPQASR